MASVLAGPYFGGLEMRDDARDLVFKVKYNGTLKRFNARVNGSYLDCNLSVLRSKIESAFKFSSDVEFILTYTDEDGDLVMLDDQNDLCDAAITQKLSPLRINVQLKNSNAEAPRTKQQASNSRSPRSAALEDQLAQMKSAIDEAMKFVPEQIPAVLAKLSHDLRSRAVSSVSSLAELLERLATLMTPNGNMPSSSGPQASRNSKIEHENELMTGSASQPSEIQNAPGLKSVLPVDHKAQAEQAPVYHSVDSLKFTSSGGKKSDHKGSTVAESKGRCASQSKGKSSTSYSVPAVSASTYADIPIQHTSAPSMSENKLRYWPTYGSNGLVGGSSLSRHASSQLPPYHRRLGSSGNISSDWQPSFAPANMYGPPKLDMPSSLGTYVSSKDGLYPIGNSYKYDVPSSVSNNPEGRHSFGSSYNYGSIPQHALHKWVQCDGCGVTPIAGPRYKSNVKGDYDLCGVCFSHMGNESEYTRLDKPASVNNQKLLGHLQQEDLKLECSFITDITIPDGTSMAPFNPFTKIWRLRNSGCTIWPFGTQVIWVGGDQFAVQNPVKLGISMYGIAGGEEVDVAVDFLAPAKPGRYASYWRLASPSGKKFGQRIWVLIQVEEPIQTSGNKLPAAIDLNLPPAANRTAKPFVDTNSLPKDPFFQYPLNIYNEILPHYQDSVIHLESELEPDSLTALNFQFPNDGETSACFQNPIMLKESEPASNTLPSISDAVKQVQIPTTVHTTSSGLALTLMTAAMPATETIPLPKSVSLAVPVSAPIVVDAPASFPGHAPTNVPTSALPDETINQKEEKLLRELVELGFGQVELNKEMLRRNNYDLKESVRELYSLDGWDPLFGELNELGFDGAAMNKEAVTKRDGGSIKGLVMSLVTRAKDQ